MPHECVQHVCHLCRVLSLFVLLLFGSLFPGAAQVSQNPASTCPVLFGGPEGSAEELPANCAGTITSNPRHGLIGTLITIQSQSGGMLIADEQNSFPLNGFQRGDRVEARGVLKKIRNRWALALAHISRLGPGTKIPPRDVLIHELQHGKYAYTLVRVSGELVFLENKPTRELGLRDRTGSVPLRIDASIMIEPSIMKRLSPGQGVEIVGIAEYLVDKDGRLSPQIRPRDSADFRFAPSPPYQPVLGVAVLFFLSCAGLYILARVRSMRRYAASLEALTQTLRHSEAALKLKEQLYRSVTETAMDAILTIGEQGQILFANQSTETLLGWTAQELKSKTLQCLIDECWGAHSSGERMETTGHHKNGQCLAIEVSLSEASEDNGYTRTAVLRDVTQRKRAEDEIRRTNRALRQLSAQLLRSQDDERRRIARELHDGTNQNLAALRIQLSILQNDRGIQGDVPRRLLAEASALADRSSREIRSLSYLLHPPMLDELGLVSALQNYVQGFCARSSVAVDLHITSHIGRLAQDTETAIFRIVQEALGNVHRHSGANHATISLESVGPEIILRIRDAGRGIVEFGSKTGKINMGVGLLGMRERARQLGGSLDISSSLAGTEVVVRLPSRQRPDLESEWTVEHDQEASSSQTPDPAAHDEGRGVGSECLTAAVSTRSVHRCDR